MELSLELIRNGVMGETKENIKATSAQNNYNPSSTIRSEQYLIVYYQRENKEKVVAIYKIMKDN